LIEGDKRSGRLYQRNLLTPAFRLGVSSTTFDIGL